jgi:hypothetical protein
MSRPIVVDVGNDADNPARLRPTAMLRPTTSLPGDCVFASVSIDDDDRFASGSIGGRECAALRTGDFQRGEVIGACDLELARRTSLVLVDSPDEGETLRPRPIR